MLGMTSNEPAAPRDFNAEERLRWGGPSPLAGRTAPWGTTPEERQRWMTRMTDHLDNHPDHEMHRRDRPPVWEPPDLEREHERLHAQALPYGGAQHYHAEELHVRGAKELASRMNANKVSTLDLKVTVEDTDPDGQLATILREEVVLRGKQTGRGVKVTKVERADGQPVGAEAEFEEYWTEMHSTREGTDWDSGEKLEARDAFMYAVRKYGKKQ